MTLDLPSGKTLLQLYAALPPFVHIDKRPNMKKAISFAAVAAALAVIPVPGLADAGGVAKAFDELSHELEDSEPGTWTVYASGAASSLGWANSILEARKEPRLYCPPRGPAEKPSAYAQVALTEYKGNKPRYDSLDKYPADAVALAVVSGLMAKYPCKIP